jgi:hypothetical protein
MNALSLSATYRNSYRELRLLETFTYLAILSESVLMQQPTLFQVTHVYTKQKRKSNRKWAASHCTGAPLATSYCS